MVPSGNEEAVVVPSDNEAVREESPDVELHYYKDVCIREGLSSSFCFRLADFATGGQNHLQEVLPQLCEV